MDRKPRRLPGFSFVLLNAAKHTLTQRQPSIPRSAAPPSRRATRGMMLPPWQDFSTSWFRFLRIQVSADRCRSS
jgi:hypothetical protein